VRIAFPPHDLGSIVNNGMAYRLPVHIDRLYYTGRYPAADVVFSFEKTSRGAEKPKRNGRQKSVFEFEGVPYTNLSPNSAVHNLYNFRKTGRVVLTVVHKNGSTEQTMPAETRRAIVNYCFLADGVEKPIELRLDNGI